MGAGIVECDVTFTKDRQLICRHAQCDLHTTTDVVSRPEFNAKCTTPWVVGGNPKCCASDFTLEEIKMLCAKMDARDSSATTAEQYLGGVADFRTTLYSNECPKVPTHKESISLMMEYGAKFTPELKTPEVVMPFEGDYTQEDFAQQMIDEYIEAGVDTSAVWHHRFCSFYTVRDERWGETPTDK
jgi:glycerophosphoryl diester phosphodiesterase